MNTSVLDSKEVQAGRYGSVITADASKDIPSRIEVMRAGNWPETSNKGALVITVNDLHEFADNFKAGIGVPGGRSFGQIPIDFSHNDDKEAAGWITDLTVEDNILFASVAWTDAGTAALKGGMYKCFSPSFWPACLGEYPDPENWQKTAKNVLVGGGLTNIPFFKDLSAIVADKRFTQASTAGNSTDDNNNARKGNIVPTLDEVRIKDVASLTADDKQVLADNKAELSADELTKFDMADKKVEAAAVTGISDEDKAVLASIKNGDVKVVKASEFNAMQESVSKLEASVKASEEKEARAFVTAQAERGAIKADAIDKWTARVLADASIKADMETMNGNTAASDEKGASVQESEITAADELREKAQAMVKADSTLTIANAYSRVRQQNPELATRYDQEIKG